MPDQLILEKKSLDAILKVLSPEEIEHLQRLQSTLTDFTLHLIQAFLRTGYYTSDHPESKKAKEGLYQKFKEVFEDEDELTFLIREEQEKKEIYVEGIMPEAQRLSRMMMRGMGELYVPRFAKYLERKELISLTLKSRMSQGEFTRFVDVMSEPTHLDMHRKEEKERFAEILVQYGVFNISYIFNEELVFTPGREMPWRARLTLTRMKKDFKMIPIIQKMMGEELQDLRRNLIRDALRPVRQSDLLCAILLNSDLAVSSESWGVVVEDEIISFLSKQYLLGTAKAFLQEYHAIQQLQKGDALEKKSDRLLKKMANRLVEEGSQEAEGLLEGIFRQGLITIEDLTPKLRDKILLERLTDKFLNYTQHFFDQLDQAKGKEAFLTVALSFVRMIPELIQRDRYPEILRIFEALRHHFHEKGMWSLLAGQILEEIGKGAIPQRLKEKFLAGKKEVRVGIIPIFAALEIGSIPVLLDILKTSQDQWVRKNACEALIQIGPVAAVHLLKELEQRQTSVETTCDILRVLGEIKSREWQAPLVRVLKSYASHEQPRLREQAIHSLCQIGGPEGEEIFLSSLNDPNVEVRKKAVWCLGMIKNPRGIEKMLEILKHLTATPSPQSDKLEAQIYYAFGLSGNLTIEGRTLEQILIEIVEKRGIKGWLGFLQKNPLTDPSLAAICDTLGKIGTRESVKVLTRLEKSQKDLLVSKIKETLKKIEDRISVSTK